MNHFLFFTIIFSTKLLFIKNNDWFEWDDPNTGNYFNFHNLKRNQNDPWTFTKISGSFKNIYKFNFGENINETCKGKTGSIVESFEIFKNSPATCSILGDYNKKQVGYINKNNPNEGIWLEYSGEEVCMHSISSQSEVYRTVRFYLFCDQKQEENVRILFVIKV